MESDDTTIQVGDLDFDITGMNSIILGDDIYTSSSEGDIMLTGFDDPLASIGNTFTWDTLLDNPSIKIGKHEITEETAEKLQALLDMIDSLENDNDLKALFNTQLAFNRIKNTDENQSN
jgi:hypothetical protein